MAKSKDKKDKKVDKKADKKDDKKDVKKDTNEKKDEKDKKDPDQSKKEESSSSNPEDEGLGALIYNWKTRVFGHFLSVTTFLGIFFFLIGLLALFLYEGRVYAFIFGLICLLQIIQGLMYLFLYKKEGSIINLIMSLMNLSWIVAAVTVFLLFKLLLINPYFERDAVFQFMVLFYILFGIVVAIAYYFILQTTEGTEDSKDSSKGDAEKGGTPPESKEKGVKEAKDDKKDKKDKKDAKEKPKDKEKNKNKKK